MNKIIIDGKEYELSDDLAMQIKAEVALQEMARQMSENPFERKTDDEGYFYVNERGEVKPAIDRYFSMDNGCFQVANYCRDKGMMEQRALHETLNRLLWRYSEMNGYNSKPWDSRSQHWCIGKGGDIAHIYRVQYNHYFGPAYFDTHEAAYAAIEEVVKPFLAAHPEFVW